MSSNGAVWSVDCLKGKLKNKQSVSLVAGINSPSARPSWRCDPQNVESTEVHHVVGPKNQGVS